MYKPTRRELVAERKEYQAQLREVRAEAWSEWAQDDIDEWERLISEVNAAIARFDTERAPRTNGKVTHVRA